MINVYWAGAFGDKERIKSIAQYARDHYGIGSTSRWLYSKEVDLDNPGFPASKYAIQDKHDVERANVFVLVLPKSYEGICPMGSSWELGYAMGLHKPCVVVGDRHPRHIFFHLDEDDTMGSPPMKYFPVLMDGLEWVAQFV